VNDAVMRGCREDSTKNPASAPSARVPTGTPPVRPTPASYRRVGSRRST